jgi:hypothetical protein
MQGCPSHLFGEDMSLYNKLGTLASRVGCQMSRTVAVEGENATGELYLLPTILLPTLYSPSLEAEVEPCCLPRPDPKHALSTRQRMQQPDRPFLASQRKASLLRSPQSARPKWSVAMTPKERQILTSFLADGLTHREIDLTLGLNPQRSKGWHSFEVLREDYGVVGTDRGVLFLYTKAQVNRVITAIGKARSRAPLDTLVPRLEHPTVLEPYRGTYVLARNALAFRRMLNGEARNAVQRFFNSRKTAVGGCQMQGCGESKSLDTVHLQRTRTHLFIQAAKAHGRPASGVLTRFDVYETFKDFLSAHMGLRPVAFLCRSHHRAMDRFRGRDPIAYRAFVRTLARGFHAGRAA